MPATLALPVELVLLITSLLACATQVRAAPQIADGTHDCVNGLISLFTNDVSPCSLWNQTQAACKSGSLDLTVCACTNAAFNIYSACQFCKGGSSVLQSQYFSSNGCSGTPSTLPPPAGYPTLPDWAYNSVLPDGTFDLRTAVIDMNHPGWTTIQIVVPITVGLVMSLVALFLVLYFRSRAQLATTMVGPRPRPTSKRGWEDARLKAPRRFFGLFSGTRSVRKETWDSEWEIDSARGRAIALEEGNISSTSLSRESIADPTSSHSRSTSTSSLLPASSGNKSPGSSVLSPKSPFQTLVSKLSNLSGKSGYTSGVQKAASYKRVAVTSDRPGDQFKIDDGSEPRSASFMSRVFRLSMPSQSTAQQQQQAPLQGPKATPRSNSLPSVIDIRAPSLAGSSSTGRGRVKPKTKGSMPSILEDHTSGNPSDVFFAKQDSRSEFSAAGSGSGKGGPRSDYSLQTMDLLTPTTSMLGHGGKFKAPRSDASGSASGRMGPRSDFSLDTMDLMTPTTSFAGHGLMSRSGSLPTVQSPRPDSVVLPNEPKEDDSPVYPLYPPPAPFSQSQTKQTHSSHTRSPLSNHE